MAELAGSAASLADFIWKNAEDLWGDFKHIDFGKIILPFTLLRRLECVLEPTRQDVRDAHEAHKDTGIDLDLILRQCTRYPFYNTSEYALSSLGGTKTRQNLQDYVAHFSDNARVIFEQFDFSNTVIRLDKAGVLFKICKNFAAVDLHPEVVPDRIMSNLYEHLIRRFGAEVNEGAEDFMTPRDVVHLATALLLDPDDSLFEANPGLIRTLYDPTCGTGGFLSDAMNHVAEYGNRFKVPPVLIPYGQELEPETHAVCLTGMLLRTLESDPGRDLSKNIKLGSTLSNDQFAGERFHYGLSNPPFGKKWEKDATAVNAEHTEKGYDGRFGPGLPRINDGSMLFLLHLASKLELPERGGGRAAIVLSGSPLFNGGAGSGESEIRRWLLENDLIEAIVALPTEIFFRTGIGTYLWILSSKKPKNRRHQVQLINATGLWTSIKNEGNKRRIISDDQIRQIVDVYSATENDDLSHMLDYRRFAYRRIRVLRPLRMSMHVNAETMASLVDEKAWAKLTPESQAAWKRALKPYIDSTHPFAWAESFTAEVAKKDADVGKVGKTFVKALVNAFGVRDPEGEPVVDKDGNTVADSDLTDYENVPFLDDIRDYFASEVLPHVPDAWIDESYVDKKDKAIGQVGYEIIFNRYFYEYAPPRGLEAINCELKQLEDEIGQLLGEVTRHVDATSKMKSTGVKWVQEIPADWDVLRLRHLASFTNSNVDKKTYEGQEAVKLCNYTDVYYNEFITANLPFMEATASETEIERFQLKKGDVIITKDSEDPSDIGVPTLVSDDLPGVVCGYHLTVIRCQDGDTSRLLHRVLMSHPTKAHFFVEAPGITRYGLGQDAIGDLPVCLPPSDQRKGIADWIDRETARIDALIEKKTRFVELLKEKRQALITAAVTGQIDLGESA